VIVFPQIFSYNHVVHALRKDAKIAVHGLVWGGVEGERQPATAKTAARIDSDVRIH
jgi:hypothetical protein